jgi:hypothetical protein
MTRSKIATAARLDRRPLAPPAVSFRLPGFTDPRGELVRSLGIIGE